MTAQVAILNRTAVAMASDSAVTISGQKLNIYQTVNKLFTVSKYEPVGVMIYGGAELMDVPWESTLKLFRKSLGAKKYPRLTDHGDAFVAFLEQNRTLFPEQAQEVLVRIRASTLAGGVAEAVIAIAKEKIDAGQAISEETTVTSTEEVIAALHTSWTQRTRLPCFSEGDEVALAGRYGAAMGEEIASELGAVAISGNSIEQLKAAVIATFTRDRFIRSSGIVLAGFGDDEISKGDGFVWIKRKHYFKPELNPSFVANYLRG